MGSTKLRRFGTLLVGTATASVLAFGAAAPASALPAPSSAPASAPSYAPAHVSGQSAASQASFRSLTVLPTARSYRSTERRLTTKTKRVHRALRAKFPRIKRVLGYRPAQAGEHGKGRALDVMIPNWRSAKGKKLGWRIARWARSRSGSLKIYYVIYNQRIWNVQRKNEGWRKMRNGGSATANHKNHVHISVRR